MRESLENLISAYCSCYINKGNLPSWDIICKTNMELSKKEAKEEYKSRINEIVK